MKISLNWVNEFVDIADFLTKPRELADVLVTAGLEVEQIENPGETFHHVVVGRIVELGRHPNADKLTLCQVDTGEKIHRQIICGAKNHRQGDKVVVATPGAVLPGDFAIKISKIRDVESQGMLCSESELGFKDESEGILLLPADAPVGESFANYWGLDDVLFDISITPNRADCLSHLGLAREISCLLNRPLKPFSVRTPKKMSSKRNLVSVEVLDTDLCQRYCGRSVFGVKIGPSPAWLRQRLESLGVNSVNNAVDVTNYVMLELGQPLHAFDLARLRGDQMRGDKNAAPKITVVRATANEKFKTFDGTELTLSGEELTIRDSERAVALAGVIGGLNSGVSETTQDIFLESASFSQKGVRRTSRRHAIETDSSYRFSRGVDVDATLEAMNRACQLLSEVAGGEPATDFVDVYPNPAKRPQIWVRRQTLSDRLGYPVDMADFLGVLKRLQCHVKETAKGAGQDQVTVEPPSFRVDLEIEMDLVEEYGRLNGYDKIPETFPILRERPSDHAESYVHEEVLREQLVREGFFEARNYAFLNSKWQTEFIDQAAFAKSGLELGGAPVAVRNPLSEETGTMRLSLVPGLVGNLLHNEHRGVHYGRLFEIGRVFVKADSPDAPYREPHRLAFMVWGHEQGLWQKPDHPVVFDLKSAITTLVEHLNGRIEIRKMDSPSFLHPGQSATLFYEGRVIGFFGSLHPLVRERHKIRSDVAIAEIDLTALMRGQPRTSKIKPISKFPSVERDFSLVVRDSVTAGELVRETEKAAGELLQAVVVFDVFRGAGVPEGCQSVSIRLTLQDFNATLSEDSLKVLTQNVLHRLGQKFDAKVRT